MRQSRASKAKGGLELTRRDKLFSFLPVKHGGVVVFEVSLEVSLGLYVSISPISQLFLGV